jgi:nucleotide-binding universal stress UspA family protein
MSTKHTIVVGIPTHDAMPILRQAAEEAHCGDTVRIVHAYAPKPYAVAGWTLAVENDEVQHNAAARHVAYAARKLRAERHDLIVEAIIRTGLLSTVILDFASNADLIVIGSPRHGPTRAALESLVAAARCPILVAGSMPTVPHIPDAPVTAVLRDLDADRPIIDAAMTEASIRHTPLVVLRPWCPAAQSNLFFAEIAEQKQLDSYLVDWQERYPQVGISIELRLGDPITVIEKYGNRSELLVIGYQPQDWQVPTSVDHAMEAAVRGRSGPTLIVSQEVCRHPAVEEPVRASA